VRGLAQPWLFVYTTTKKAAPPIALFDGWAAGTIFSIRTLVLVDAFWLKIFPVTLGGGKRLFANGTIPAAFKVTESAVTSKAVIIVNYERAGAVPTGSL
jgi:hypothetical protein